MTPLSIRVAGWLSSLRPRRTRDPFGADETRAWLRKRSRPVWDAAVDVEVAFGGVIGCGDAGGVVSFGVHPWFGRISVHDGRVCVLVGYVDPVSVFVDEDGAVIEVDDHNVVAGVADSLAQRLEQRALELSGRCVEVVDGRRGEVWAALLGLAPLVEACDQHQQWWATSPPALTLKQWRDDDSWRTMLASDEPLLLDVALALLRS